MEDTAVNATENNLLVTNDSTVNAPGSITADKSVGMHGQLVTDAANNDVPADASDKTGAETRCNVVDGVKYEWTDITTEFIGACSSLELGELVHDSKYVAFDEF